MLVRFLLPAESEKKDKRIFVKKFLLIFVLMLVAFGVFGNPIERPYDPEEKFGEGYFNPFQTGNSGRYIRIGDEIRYVEIKGPEKIAQNLRTGVIIDKRSHREILYYRFNTDYFWIFDSKYETDESNMIFFFYNFKEDSIEFTAALSEGDIDRAMLEDEYKDLSREEALNKLAGKYNFSIEMWYGEKGDGDKYPEGQELVYLEDDWQD
jgi:hypothetical protein